MVYTARPLAARLAVFWHNHFATSNVKVNRPALMLQQLRTFEQHALGSFDQMLLAVARDPAMILWLDGDENHKGRPNENFARELLELFTLGVGNYSERDIKEIARAFTGWRQRDGSFYFNRRDHDDGLKEALGRRGGFDGGDIVPLVLTQPAAAEFLARKLMREFVSDTPDAELVAAFADVMRAEKFNIAAALRILLASRAMFAAGSYRARISSPVEFVVGTLRTLEMRMYMHAAARACGEMGQRLFEPPTVKGWDGGRTWIDSATMLVRMNGAAAACRARNDGLGFQAAEFCERHQLDDAKAAAKVLSDLLLDGKLPPALEESIDEAADRGKFEDAVRTIVQLILASPEYQLV